MKNYIVSTLENAPYFVRNHDISHVISITRRQPWLENFKHIQWHKIYCEDVDDPSDEYAPTQEQVSNILDIMKSIPDNSTVLIHCEAGMSRSPAITLAALVQDMGVENIQECIKKLKKIRPYCFPNKLITHYADIHLKTNGEITRAAEEIYNELVILQK